MFQYARPTLACSVMGGVLAIGLAHMPLNLAAQSSSDIRVSYPAAGAPVQATVNIDKASINVDFNLEADFAVVRISGPDFYTISKRIDNADRVSVDLLKDLDFSAYVDSEIEQEALADAISLPDGRYTFEIMAHSAEGIRHTTRGSFEVYAGNAFLLPSRAAMPSTDEGVSDIGEPGLMQRIAGSILNFVVPSAHAQSSFVDDFVSVTDTANDNDTGVNLFNDSFTDFGMRNKNGVFVLKDSTGPVGSGDTVFLNIVGSTGKVGFGTQDPQATMHLVTPNAFAGFRLEDSRNSWQISTGGFSEDLGFRVADISAGTSPFRIDSGAPTDSIRVATNGNVGLGTDDPAVNLDIVDTARAAVAMNAGADQQADFTLATGGVDRWVFRARAVNNNFEIARRDAGGGFLDVPLLIPYSDGVTQIRNGMTHIPTTTPPNPGAGATVFVDSANGDLRVKFANGTVKTLATN